MKVNAVFEGGGVRAIGLVGAIKAAEKFHIRFNQLAGTSSGALVASFLAAGYTADEMREMILEMPFSSFVQKNLVHRIHGLGPALRLLFKKGLYSKKPLEKWVSDKLSLKGIHTFGDLDKNKLRIIASDITSGRMLVLPGDIRNYGRDPDRLKVSEAVMMSTAIPYFFEPVVLKSPQEGNKTSSYIVDGALLSNFPLWLFDQNYTYGDKMVPTIGFRLVGKNKNLPNRIIGPISMFRALFSTMMDAHDERYIEKMNRFRTIKIPVGSVPSTDFHLSKEKAGYLYQAGVQSGMSFFTQWSLSEYMMQFEKVVVKKR